MYGVICNCKHIFPIQVHNHNHLKVVAFNSRTYHTHKTHPTKEVRQTKQTTNTHTQYLYYERNGAMWSSSRLHNNFRPTFEANDVFPPILEWRTDLFSRTQSMGRYHDDGDAIRMREGAEKGAYMRCIYGTHNDANCRARSNTNHPHTDTLN